MNKKFGINLIPNVVFIFSLANAESIVIIKADGTDSKKVSNKPTSWSKIFFFFFPSGGFLTRR